MQSNKKGLQDLPSEDRETQARENLYNEYDSLLSARATMTSQIVELESRNVANRFSDRILMLDRKRVDAHRELEKIGKELEKSRLDVLGDIVLFEMREPRLEIPGMTAIPATINKSSQYLVERDEIYNYDEKDRAEFTDGVIFVFSSEAHTYAWRTEISSKTKNTPEFEKWLEQNAEELLKILREHYPSHDIQIRNLLIDHSGVSHVDRTSNRGIFVPSEILSSATSIIREAGNWISRDELKDHQETLQEFSNQHILYADEYRCFLNEINSNIREHLSEEEQKEFKKITLLLHEDHPNKDRYGALSSETAMDGKFCVYKKTNQTLFSLHLNMGDERLVVIEPVLASEFLEKFRETTREFKEAEIERELDKIADKEAYDEEVTVRRLESKRVPGKFKR